MPSLGLGSNQDLSNQSFIDFIFQLCSSTGLLQSSQAILKRILLISFIFKKTSRAMRCLFKRTNRLFKTNLRCFTALIDRSKMFPRRQSAKTAMKYRPTVSRLCIFASTLQKQNIRTQSRYRTASFTACYALKLASFHCFSVQTQPSMQSVENITRCKPQGLPGVETNTAASSICLARDARGQTSVAFFW